MQIDRERVENLVEIQIKKHPIEMRRPLLEREDEIVDDVLKRIENRVGHVKMADVAGIICTSLTMIQGTIAPRTYEAAPSNLVQLELPDNFVSLARKRLGDVNPRLTDAIGRTSEYSLIQRIARWKYLYDNHFAIGSQVKCTRTGQLLTIKYISGVGLVEIEEDSKLMYEPEDFVSL